MRTENDKKNAAPAFVKSIAVDIILTLFTCGLWNLWVQARQIRAVNFMIEQEKYHYWKWLALSLITCGLWHIYHEFRLSQDIAVAMGKGPNDIGPIVHLVLTLFALSIIADALQQAEINSYFGSHGL